MTSTHKWLLAVTATAVLSSLIGNRIGAENARKEIKKHESTIHDAEALARFKAWAYVAKTKEIGSGETLKLIVVPHPYGDSIYDTKCIIYANSELKQTSMSCQGTDNLTEKENE